MKYQSDKTEIITNRQPDGTYRYLMVPDPAGLKDHWYCSETDQIFHDPDYRPPATDNPAGETSDFIGQLNLSNDALAVLGWLKQHGKTAFTRRDLMRAMRRRFNAAAKLDRPLEELLRNGDIRAVEGENSHKNGRPPSQKYLFQCDKTKMPVA